ncbi:TPA: hypothetical protein SAO08_002616 [Burkholderia multivorans]|uniref:hypothetical protein n=1 Tax=Burkholderia TaxID=32008 RepID=UPI0011120330|nr:MULTISPECIES: hypothetical protein [Burkholderia]MBH9661581.1 hypothetical protein [Burkholderia multivorans]MBU9314226.1 hypothetical protein [Burkholderia multivorans]MCA8481859.1 hypothetical protein [Burkholderia multivorans]MCL4650038.1 hypothetical protein [Burkholderia multivorans]MCL4656942.1 hypothetical protein [Burkholderia multivorans]
MDIPIELRISIAAPATAVTILCRNIAGRMILALHASVPREMRLVVFYFLAGIRETLHAHHEADYEGSFSEVLSVDCCFVAYLYFPYCDVWTADLPREMGPLCEDMCKQRAVWKAGAASPAIWT